MILHHDNHIYSLHYFINTSVIELKSMVKVLR